MSLSKLKNPNTILSIALQFSIILLSIIYPLLYPQTANATISTGYIRLDRQSQTATLSGTVCMQSTITNGSVTKVFVTLPSTFSLVSTNWNSDTTAGNLPSGATAWPGISGPTTVSTATNTAIFASTDLTNSSNLYCFHFTASTSTVGTAGNNLTGTIQTQTVTGAPVETLSYATAITSGVNSEQIQVTATVSASFSFALSGGDPNHNLPLGVLNSSSVTTAPYQVTATISTNGHNGFLAWVKGTNSSTSNPDNFGGVLHSTTANADMTSTVASYPTITDLASNTGYGIYGVSGTNAPSIAAGYTASNGTTVGRVMNTQFNQIASKTGYQSGTTFNISTRAKPATTDPAATDYSDTLTVVASGSF